jgi:hypothetical protein
MVQGCQQLRLPMESGYTIGVVSKIFGQDFQCDFAAQPGIAGAVHLPHSARADHSGNLVMTEPGSKRQGEGARPGGAGAGPSWQKTGGIISLGEQRFHLPAQRLVLPALVVQELMALFGWSFQDGIE